MPISIIPKFLQKAFATVGAKADIPINADLLNGRAGYNEGFPPINMTAVVAGGIPPYGQDMNGVLFDLSAAIQYQQSGVLFPFNSAFATAIGGYAAGAIVSDATDKSMLWINGTANNLAYPSGWLQTSLKAATESYSGTVRIATQSQANAGTDNFSVITPQKMRFGFAILLAANGYITFPTWMGGLIIQWGTASVTTGTLSVTLPIAFTSSAHVVVGVGQTAHDAAVGGSCWVETGVISRSQIFLKTIASSPSGNVLGSRGVYWFSVGS